MERCSNCGATLSSMARLCANCGQVITPLPLPIPPQIPSSQQVPMVQGAPSPFNVPALQGTPGFSGAPTGSVATPSAPAPNLATSAASAPSVAPSATQPFQPGTHSTGGHYHQQGIPAHWSQYTQPSHMPYSPQVPPMPQSQQGYGKPQPSRKQHMQHTAKVASKTGIDLTTKWVIIAIVSILVVAGSASAFVLASHSHTTGPGSTTLATSSHSGATSTACIRQGDGPACPTTATSTSPVGTNLPIGDFVVHRFIFTKNPSQPVARSTD